MAIALKVEIHGRPGRGDEITTALIEMAQLVSEHEPGCLRYDVGRSREYPDDFVVWEIYVDELALDRHRTTPHFVRLIQGSLSDLVCDRRRDTYDTVSGDPALVDRGSEP